ncbi:MAG: dTMP kinase [Bacillota bacterium]|nr:dTMP kinase [Bacillota bacterium]
MKSPKRTILNVNSKDVKEYGIIEGGKALQKRGTFISLEGIDGCGKTTLKNELLSKLGIDYRVLSIREPGGTETSEKIRDLLLDVRNGGILARTEAMLYATARCQLVEEVILPALEEGKLVIADRFIDSTVAYQGFGRGLDIEFLNNLNQLCTGGVVPDLTLLLDIDPVKAYKRRKGDVLDRLELEGVDFQTRVREGYLELCHQEPERIKCLDASRSVEKLTEMALKQIYDRF